MPKPHSRSVQVICARCKQPFISTIALLARGDGKYCSMKCLHDISWQERFMLFVLKTNTCWFWNGGRNKAGYGCFYKNGRQIMAHRAAWELSNAPAGALQVCHKCDVPWCVNPDHLFLGTQKENLADRGRKGRAPIGERVWNAKLSEIQAREILALAVKGNENELAQHYGVSSSLIRRIRDGRAWKHLRVGGVITPPTM